jgi:excisionase family DNA binding protein
MAAEKARPRYLQPEEQQPSVGHLVSVADVAAMTGLSDTAVYRAIAAGELRATTPRGRLRIRLSDIDVWIEANAVQPPPSEPERAISRPRGGGLAIVAPAAAPRRGRGLRELLHAQA